jgi:hypothetical protein
MGGDTQVNGSEASESEMQERERLESMGEFEAGSLQETSLILRAGMFLPVTSRTSSTYS